MNYWLEMINAAEEGAHRQRLANGSVYSLLVPLTDISSAPAAVIQDGLSQVIHGVERQGWTLDRASSFNKTRGDGDRVLLIFRIAQPAT